MENFWDSGVWGTLNLFAVLLISLLLANALKRSVKFLRISLIPTSVLGGAILLLIAGIYKLVTGELLFDTEFFGGDGMAALEVITYHALALGFIASTFKSTEGKLSKKRTREIFDSGVTTVSTYLVQAVFGLGVTIIAGRFFTDIFPASGVILPFGYGQGTGQAMNYGNIYETQYGFEGGKSFGLTIAALGFISAAIGGVIHLNLLKRKGVIVPGGVESEGKLRSEEIQSDNEIPMQGSMDKLTVQVAFVVFAYFVCYFIMYLLGMLLPGMKSVIYGFNFLIGVLSATLIKLVMNLLKKKNIIKRQYINNFLMTRCSNFFYDIMVVAGIAAIRLGIFKDYWGVIAILAVGGAVITYFYLRFVSRALFPEYPEEQFLATYGMLTGTASTGIILLREMDGDFKTPAADNMVYQTFPAIVFGLPLMLLASIAPKIPGKTWLIALAYLVFMIVILFRSKIFRRKKAGTAK